MQTGMSQRTDQSRRGRLWLLAFVLACIAVVVVSLPRLVARIAGNIELQPGLALLAIRPGPVGLPTSLPDLLTATADLTVQMSLRNRNWLDVTLLRVEWRATLNGSVAASGTLPVDGKPLLLRADAARELPIFASVPLASAGAAGVGAVMTGEATIDIRGTAHGSVLGVAVDQDFMLPLRDIRVDVGASGKPP